MSNSATRSPPARRSRHRRPQLLVSCEHGGNRVPKNLTQRFAAAASVLDSHRGLDYGALEVARAFGKALGVAPFTATTTRLVVDLNRSPYHKNVFSEYTRSMSRTERAATMARHYWPYRNAVEDAVRSAAERGERALHVSVHSFTPVLRGEERNCDLGFLYDPARAAEVRFIDVWQAAVRDAAPGLRVRRNYPYRGVSDSLVTHLRRRFGAAYAGIELEINQKHVDGRGWRALVRLLTATLAVATAP